MKHILTFLFAALLIFQASNCQSLESAYKKLDDKNYGAALKEFEELYKSNDNNVDFLNGYIIANVYSREFKEALKLADAGIENFPNNAQLYFNRGRIYNVRKQFEKAVDDFTKALNIGIENSDEVYYQRGISYQNLDELNKSLADLEQAIEINPNKEEYYNLGGITLYKKNEFQQAIEFFDIALSFGKENPLTYYNQSMAYFKIDDKYNGCATVQKACKLGHKTACEIFIEKCINLNR